MGTPGIPAGSAVSLAQWNAWSQAPEKPAGSDPKVWTTEDWTVAVVKCQVPSSSAGRSCCKALLEKVQLSKKMIWFDESDSPYFISRIIIAWLVLSLLLLLLALSFFIIPALWSSSMDATWTYPVVPVGFLIPEVQLLDASRLRHEAVTPSAASLSCTCRHGYRVNQLFIWDMFGCAPITPVDMWRKRVIPSGQKCCEASHFCCFAGSVWEPPWKTESRGSFWNFGTPFFPFKVAFFGRHWLERQLWFGFPFCEFASQQFQKQTPCSVFFHETWRLHLKTCKIAVLYVLPSVGFSGQFWYITVTFLPVPTSFIS